MSKSKPRKCKLTEMFLRSLKPDPAGAFLVWDAQQHGLAIRMQPSGRRAWTCIYSFHSRPRWLHLGDARAIGLADARVLAAEAMLAVARGRDPAAERKAQRGKGTFEELAVRYLEEWAKRKNKSWKQADKLVRGYLLPRWGKLQAVSISRADVRSAIASINAPVLANQVLAAASAIFSWAVKNDILTVNPCRGVDRNETRSRERVLSDSEIKKFWAAFDDTGLMQSMGLKLILLTGQRPGEVQHMRREHISDGWWTLPGAPDPALKWPGTKNGETHRVWLPAPAQQLLSELLDDGKTVGPVFPHRPKLDFAMREICAKLGVNEKATPHDLRRTHGTTITALKFGRDAMNRVQNHKEGGIASVYDRHGYAEENKKIMETVAAHIMALVSGEPGASNVIAARFSKR